MGVVQNIKNAFRRDATKSEIGVTGIDRGGGFRYFDLDLFRMQSRYSYDYTSFANHLRKGYGSNPYVYAVVSHISRTYRMLPRAWFSDPKGEDVIERLTGAVKSADDLLFGPFL